MTVFYRLDREGGFTVLDTEGVSFHVFPGNMPEALTVALLESEAIGLLKFERQMREITPGYSDVTYDAGNRCRIEDGRRDGTTRELRPGFEALRTSDV